MDFITRSIHEAQGPDEATGAMVQPIHLATTFAQDGVGELRAGFEYSRTGNPTRAALEQSIAGLESAKHGFAFGSGSAASATVMLLLNPGDHVVYSEDVYGGTFRLFDKVCKRYGITFTAVDATDPDNVERAITSQTKMIWSESPTNPLLRVIDIAALAKIAKRHSIPLCIDNTFATPYLQRPLELGADMVVHSTTKYLGGHSDVVGGAAVTSNDEIAERIAFLQNAVGAVPSPFDCWLLLRGIKTLGIRMERHCTNALAVAEFLSDHPRVKTVFYPGLASHPSHGVAKKQMPAGFGGMVSFEVPTEKDALEVMARLRLFAVAESLGAVESLACYPPRMTHAAIPVEERHRIGINDGLIRLSVGNEASADLIADLDQALD